MIRRILDDPQSSYNRAWDLKLRRLYFYKEDTSISTSKYENFELPKTDEMPNDWSNNQELEELMNSQMGKLYVHLVVMKECDEIMVNEKSRVPRNAEFVSYDTIFDYMKRVIEKDKRN